jgi:hypothetical protein
MGKIPPPRKHAQAAHSGGATPPLASGFYARKSALALLITLLALLALLPLLVVLAALLALTTVLLLLLAAPLVLAAGLLALLTRLLLLLTLILLLALALAGLLLLSHRVLHGAAECRVHGTVQAACQASGPMEPLDHPGRRTPCHGSAGMGLRLPWLVFSARPPAARAPRCSRAGTCLARWIGGEPVLFTNAAVFLQTV